MKNRKSIIIVIATVVIVAAVVVGSILLFKGKQNTGDSDDGAETPTSSESTPSPTVSEPELEKQVKSAIQTLLDFSEDEDEKQDDLLVETESRSGFEVISCEKTDTGAVATIRVYAPNLYAVAKELDENNQFTNKEEMRQAVIEAIGKAEIVEQEIPIEYVMTENGLEPILSIEFIDAYYGGIFKLLAESFNKENEEVTE